MIYFAVFLSVALVGATTTAVVLAVKLVAAEKRVSAAVEARLLAEREALDHKTARVAAESLERAANDARDDAQTSLTRCNEDKGRLYAKLREAGAPGAGDALDGSIGRLYPDKGPDGGDPGPGSG